MKVRRLNESDIQRIVKKVLTENYGYDEYISNIQLGDTFRDTFNGDIFRVTDIQQNNPDGEGEDYETWVELENKGGEVVSFPHDYERGVRFNDVFTKVYLKPKYNYPPLDNIQLNEQEESDTISSKELKKLSKKGWESGTPGYLISQIIKLDTEFYSFDGVGQTQMGASMSSEHLFNRWRKENGLDPRTSTWRKTIYKKEPNVVYVKTLFPVSKFNKKG